ncbi:unnamed protein product [Adineta ricciae]|nr:unnamed protein product [Adineta ricciae]
MTETNQPPIAYSVDEKKRKVIVVEDGQKADELQEEITASTVVDEEENLLTPEQIKEFFTATAEGSIERLNELFDKTPHSDPNMTQFAESLLMAAIRAKQERVAEYLIDQFAIDADHKTELLEFRVRGKIPIYERTLSSRDLAYDEGMMNLVDLIDIASKEVKPSTKRFLQRRIQPTLDGIHQAYVKRLEERKTHSIKRVEVKESEETSIIESKDNIDSSSPSPSSPAPPTLVPIIDRSCKSYIEETLHNIQSSNEKSIDETGKKYFRFSGYTLRYRIVDTINPHKEKPRKIHPKKPVFSFSTTLPQINSRSSPSTLSTSKSHTSTSNVNSRSMINLNTPVSIRETRTSICRSALHRMTPRAPSRTNSDCNSDVQSTILPVNNIPRFVLPKRIPRVNTNYEYIPQSPSPILYKESDNFIPVTLKSTAIGLPSDKVIIRD